MAICYYFCSSPQIYFCPLLPLCSSWEALHRRSSSNNNNNMGTEFKTTTPPPTLAAADDASSSSSSSSSRRRRRGPPNSPTLTRILPPSSPRRPDKPTVAPVHAPLPIVRRKHSECLQMMNAADAPGMASRYAIHLHEMIDKYRELVAERDQRITGYLSKSRGQDLLVHKLERRIAALERCNRALDSAKKDAEQKAADLEFENGALRRYMGSENLTYFERMRNMTDQVLELHACLTVAEQENARMRDKLNVNAFWDATYQSDFDQVQAAKRARVR